MEPDSQSNQSNPNSQINPIIALPKMPALLLVWRWLFGLGFAILGLLGSLALLLVLQTTSLSGLASAGISVLLLAMGMGLAAWLGYWYAGQRYAHYQAGHHVGYGVMLKSGVGWRSEVWVPLVRLQHIDVHQDPLDRRWGMATLSLYTAGTHENELRIKGLPVAQAHDLRQALLPTTRAAHE